MRLSKDEYYMNIAREVSKRSTCLRAQCGSVLVSNDAIISTGYNGSCRSSKNCIDAGKCKREGYKPQEGTHLCEAVHSEVNTVINVARNGSGSTIGSTLYVYFNRLDDSINSYTMPCDGCMRVIRNAGICRILNHVEDKEKIGLYEILIVNGNVSPMGGSVVVKGLK